VTSFHAGGAVYFEQIGDQLISQTNVGAVQVETSRRLEVPTEVYVFDNSAHNHTKCAQYFIHYGFANFFATFPDCDFGWQKIPLTV
jgi:hypothetical protein